MFLGSLTASFVALAVCLLFYNNMMFGFMDSALLGCRIKRWQRHIFGLMNAVAVIFFMLHSASTSMTAYIFMLILLTAELSFGYKDLLYRIFFAASAFLLHIMAVRAVCVAVYSLITGYSFYSISNNPNLLLHSMLITFIVLCVFLFLVKNLVSPQQIAVIKRYPDQHLFLSICSFVYNVAFILNAQVYSVDEAYSFLATSQIIFALTILIALYICIFFAIKTGKLLQYKEKNQELELVVHEEQQFRSSMVQNCIASYEFNLSKNQVKPSMFLAGSKQEKTTWLYTDFVSQDHQHVLHPQDKERVLKHSAFAHLQKSFAEGVNQLTIEYRRLNEAGNYIWVEAITNLVKDAITGDVKGFTYLKDIDADKKTQLELQKKAERDSLTGLYNKGTTSKLISDYLQQDCSKEEIGILFIIDIDNFKAINDNLGHTFGDAVLCELSEKLQNIFRPSDIVGRIGGDEFIAFIKNAKNIAVIQARVKEVAKAFFVTYKDNDELEYGVSASIGVASAPLNGTTFQELYQGADIALYGSKNKGKNTYTIYEGETFHGYKSNRTEIDAIGKLPQKSFKSNRIEYVFKILYQAENPSKAVCAVLELLAKHFNFSRGYIFEVSADGHFLRNSFEWCNEGIAPEIQNLQQVGLEVVQNAITCFYQTGTYIVTGLKALTPAEQEILEPQGIKSMLQFGMFDHNQFLGFIGFDDCLQERTFLNSEIDELSTICNLLTLFIIKEKTIQVPKGTPRS